MKGALMFWVHAEKNQNQFNTAHDTSTLPYFEQMNTHTNTLHCVILYHTTHLNLFHQTLPFQSTVFEMFWQNLWNKLT